MTMLYLSEAVRFAALGNPAAVGDRPLYNQALKLIRNGRLPVVRDGRAFMVRPEDVPVLAGLLGLAPREPAAAA